MPEYLRVLWKHNNPDEPVELLYELGPDRSVVRMVEKFGNGRAWADTLKWHAIRYPTFQGVSLVDLDMPTADEMRATAATNNPEEFEVFESTQIEFEAAFVKATPLHQARGNQG